MSDLTEHLQSLEQRLFEPEIRASVTALESLLSPEFREIGASGRLYGYGDIVAGLLAEPPDGTTRTLTDFELLLLASDLALVTYRAMRTVPAGPPVSSLRSSIWRHDADRQWRMVFHQGTLTG
ncbi:MULTISPECIES: DUF4440 domain-containing protein [unclassified Rhizobium]|jgi:hypothetical protein|uniref:nuclear transport factor 2 family protein n=1 Tax=unclassified Rhizobium TaxID=2613769 RepID=UPI001614E418|nr:MULTISPECIES: DUF4440 domain-containing protein [unclassified Rhizobium]MBB3541617.1 hypothetical protein [Rhizobium sp. BK399]MCS3740803.1 hypothetical protein [Rhizobium sp. BK661]MCS4092362.1 hypothetical protein [Rhizobium sp. BK176]